MSKLLYNRNRSFFGGEVAMLLEDRLSVLKGFGDKAVKTFQKLGIETVADVLLYFPFRYDDFKQRQVADLADGEKAVLTGLVVTPPNVQYYGFKRNRLSFKLKQGEAVFAVTFFNQPYLADKVELGKNLAVFGKWDGIKQAVTGLKILAQVHDEMQPIYHVTQGVRQTSLVKAITAALEAGYLALLPENLPEVLLTKYRLMPRQEAVLAMHFPLNPAQYQQALRRIKFEELFYFQLQLQMVKAANRLQSGGLTLSWDKTLLTKRLTELPFVLTEAQQRSLDEILGDMASGCHMNRLLQGDVGSGKTVIAGLAMYAAHTAGFQSALMVPTEILAEQHYESLQALFPDLSIALLKSGMKAAQRRAALQAIAQGQVDMIVGTHALIQEAVDYHRLGLVVTDEQHRFGVKQRRLFREKGDNPDVLMMTATPIPRTLAITAFGDMDVSIIDQLPAGRKPIVTRWVKHEQLEQVLAWVGQQVRQGAQVYVISPLIEESESLDLKNAIALENELKAYFGESISVALVHGRLASEDKERVMTAFKDGEIAVLVSTTVIEVGVNVPNATIMMIMDADRFGLSQLHQLRGRVGRGHKQSYAILVANPKTETGQQRMRIMTETTDGFVLAEEDLKMRGSGDIFGTKQSGLPDFKAANVIEDYPILEEARKVAKGIVTQADWQEDSRWSVLLEHLPAVRELD